MDSAAGNPSVSSKPSVRLPTLAPMVKIPTFAPMVRIVGLTSTATPGPMIAPQPTPTRNTVALGETEFFGGDTAEALKRADAQFRNGEYEAAVGSYREAKRHHSKPSPVIENRIGMTHLRLEQYGLAILHFSNAIGINNNVPDRVNRSRAYKTNGQCAPAVTDAEAILMMEPTVATNYHSHLAANEILSICYFKYGNKAVGLEHLDAAIAIGKSHNFDANELNQLIEAREAMIQASQ